MTRVAAWMLASILLATGLGKALDVPGFAAIVAQYDALPARLALPAALTLIAIELGLSAWLASAVSRRRAGLASAALHACYAAWSGLALARGLDIPNCGCFGVFLARPLTPVTLAEDAALVALSLIAARR